MGDFNIDVTPDRKGTHLTVSAPGNKIAGVLDRNSTAALVEALCRCSGLPQPWKKG